MLATAEPPQLPHRSDAVSRGEAKVCEARNQQMDSDSSRAGQAFNQTGGAAGWGIHLLPQVAHQNVCTGMSTSP